MKFWKALFLTRIFYISLAGIVVLLVLGYFFPMIVTGALVLAGVLLIMAIADVFQLYSIPASKALTVVRSHTERFSNGDPNPVTITLKNNYSFPIAATVTDELPIQFQIRDFQCQLKIKPGETRVLTYSLRPMERGEYHFGTVNVLVQSPMQMVARNLREVPPSVSKVYPSFLQMRNFQLMAISDRLNEIGIKKIRRIGHQMEFDQIRDYIRGDDYRTINWKATARKQQLMVNQYQDEKSQQVYSLIDMGRTMKMPFEGMTLLDYAINTSLVISNIAMVKHDKAGLLTFNHKVRSMLPAGRNEQHLQNIMECLYNQQTSFSEHNLAAVYAHVRQHIHHRSLLMIFTNFESLSSAQRQLPVLNKLAVDHLVVVVFFENTEIKSLTKKSTIDTEQIYIKTIAEKFIYDKKLIAKQFEQYGIHTVLTEPGKLTVNAINKYLELKARGYI